MPNVWSLMQIKNILKTVQIGEKNNQWMPNNYSGKIDKKIQEIKILLNFNKDINLCSHYNSK